METTEIKSIVILVQLKNGNAHQVLCNPDQKQVAINLLMTDGDLLLSPALEPVMFKLKK